MRETFEDAVIKIANTGKAKKVRQTIRKELLPHLVSEIIRPKPKWMPRWWYVKKLNWVIPGIGEYIK